MKCFIRVEMLNMCMSFKWILYECSEFCKNNTSECVSLLLYVCNVIKKKKYLCNGFCMNDLLNMCTGLYVYNELKGDG